MSFNWKIGVAIAGFLLSVVFLIVSLVLAFKVFPDMLDTELKEGVLLRKGTEQYEKFIELPNPLLFKIYVYNVDNAELVLSEGARPHLTEMGPFVYRQYRHKNVIYSDCDEDSITYTETETFQFDPLESKGLTEDTPLTVFNLPLMFVYEILEANTLAPAVPPFDDPCVETFFPGHDSILTPTTIKELMFDGINFCSQDQPLTCAIIVPLGCNAIDTDNSKYLEPFGDSIKFSFLNYRRALHGDKYGLSRGLVDLEKKGEILRVNDLENSNVWVGENSTCNRIRGGRDSLIYPPQITSESVLDLHSSDVCRRFPLSYSSETSYKDINGLKFATSPDLYNSKIVIDGTPSDPPESDCFCTLKTVDVEGDGISRCFLDGIMDLQTCTGLPVLLSNPHFLHANNSIYSENLDGIGEANEDDHNTYFVIEPNTGTLLKGVRRLQLNAVLRPIANSNRLANLPRTILPMLWFEEEYDLSDSGINYLRRIYFDKIDYYDTWRWSLIATSTALIVISAGFLIHLLFFLKKLPGI